MSETTASSPAQPALQIDGDATAEEVAAVVAVLSAFSAAASSPAGTPRRRSEWAAPERMMRPAHRHGPGGWKAGALPR